MESRVKYYIKTIIWIWMAFSTIAVYGETVLFTDTSGSISYVVVYTQYKYSWEEAVQSCASRDTFSVASSPLPGRIMQEIDEILEAISVDVWIAKQQKNCQTLKKECKEGSLSSTRFGGSRCTKYEWVATETDCGGRMRYVICQTVPATTTVATTTTSTTTPTTTSVTTPTTATTAATTPTTNPGSPDMFTTIKRFTLKPPVATGKSDGGQIPSKVASFFFALMTSDNKDLLGLIVAVVMGSFLIAALCVCICCACDGRSKNKQQKKYELIHGFSTITMDRGHRTDTTEDTSIEDGSSDGRSHSMRHDDLYDGIVFPSILPPPPLLQEHTTTASVYDVRPPNSLQNTAQSRRYNTMGGRMPVQRAVENNMYASINKQRRQGSRDDLAHTRQDIPLPPPPPNHGSYSPVDLLGDDQCSIAGCRSDTGTPTSNRSIQGRNGGRPMRNPSPQPTTYTPASSRSNQSRTGPGRRRGSLELVSTNL